MDVRASRMVGSEQGGRTLAITVDVMFFCFLYCMTQRWFVVNSYRQEYLFLCRFQLS